MPHAEEYHVVRQEEGNPLVLGNLRELNGRSGFVIAPFVVRPDCPIVVISGNHATHRVEPGRAAFRRTLSAVEQADAKHDAKSGTLNSYKLAFGRFHDALLAGRFQKLVLARSESCAYTPASPDEQAAALESLFLDACQRYPRMFVTLFSAPQTGTWLMATPEVLVQGSTSPTPALLSTMALAGTMKLEGEQLRFDNPDRSGVQDIRWSQKNIQEQRLVATYIADVLKGFADDITERGPYTTRAANLVHLRSDFTFVPKAGIGIGDMVSALHPTPAVCGLPKAEAQAFILQNEPSSRRYYSGFCGPLDVSGSTHLFVSLRCMEIFDDSCRLYAGGGLLIDSVEEQEWQETEAKMQTMRQLME